MHILRMRHPCFTLLKAVGQALAAVHEPPTSFPRFSIRAFRTQTLGSGFIGQADGCPACVTSLDLSQHVDVQNILSGDMHVYRSLRYGLKGYHFSPFDVENPIHTESACSALPTQ